MMDKDESIGHKVGVGDDRQPAPWETTPTLNKSIYKEYKKKK